MGPLLPVFRIVVGVLIMLLAYNAGQVITRAHVTHGQHQCQDNVIRSERYL